LREVAWPRGAQRHAGEDALEVADLLEDPMQRLERGALAQQLHGVLALRELGAVADRAVEPAPQQAAPHGRGAAVEERREREVGARPQARLDLEVAPRLRVHDERLLAPLAGERA